MEVRGRGTHVCWLYCSLWLTIVTNYKVTYTPIICVQYIVTHVLEQLSVQPQGPSSLRNVGIHQSILCNGHTSEDRIYKTAES
jgi:hypothetical protein